MAKQDVTVIEGVGIPTMAAMQSDMERIWEICHVKTPPHTKAYTHFQRDFDTIRAITKRWLKG
jgi:hypothetical protein